MNRLTKLTHSMVSEYNTDSAIRFRDLEAGDYFRFLGSATSNPDTATGLCVKTAGGCRSVIDSKGNLALVLAGVARQVHADVQVEIYDLHLELRNPRRTHD